MNKLYIDPKGIIKVIDVPEEPKCYGRPDCCYGRKCEWLQWSAAAKEAGIEVVEIRGKKDITLGDKNSITDIPEGWRVEIKHAYMVTHTEDMHDEGWRQVAVLLPPVSEIKLDRLGNTSKPKLEKVESQEELWDEAQLMVKEHLGTYSNDLVCDLAKWAIEALKRHYILTRKT